MSPALAAVAVGIVASALVAVSARQARVAVLGIALTLVLTPLLTSTPGSLLPLAARVVAALLAAYLLSIAARGDDLPTEGSSLGWPVEAAAAAAAGVAGLAAAGLGSPAVGPPEAQAAAFGLLVLAAGPVVRARDALRLTIGLLLVVQATALVRSSLAGSPSALEEAGWAVLVAAVAAGGALVAVVARAVTGSLELAELGRVGTRARQPDAHPIHVREADGVQPPRRGRIGIGRRATLRRGPAVTPPTWSVTLADTDLEPVRTPVPEMEVVPLEAEPVVTEPGPAASELVELEPVVTEPEPAAGELVEAEPVAEAEPEPAVAAPETEPAAEPEPAVAEPEPESVQPPQPTPRAARLRPRIKARSAAGRSARIMPPPDEPS
jgi:hypothetical protein